MGGYSDLLFGPANSGTVDLVQQPVQRPAPITRPGSSPQRPTRQPRVQEYAAPQPTQGEPAASVKSYSDEVFGPVEEPPSQRPAAQPAQPAPSAVADPNAEPDAPTWYGRAAQMVRGKQDPRYRDMPTIAEVMLKEGKLGPGTGLGSEQWGWLTGANDKEMGKVYGQVLGDRFIRQETDANRYPIVVYKGYDGKEARAYVNKPGLDMQDIVRGTVEMGPFGVVGRGVTAATKGAALLPRMLVQGMAQGGTAVAQDAAGTVLGPRDFDFEKTKGKAAAAAIGGAGGEAVGQAISAFARRVVGQPRLYDKAAGKLTPEGETLARSVGIDLDGLPPDALQKFAREMVSKGDPEIALRQMANDEFNIRRTMGEVTGNKGQLLREQQMHGGAYGEEAQRGMQAFRNAQEADLRAIAGTEAARIAPDRVGTSMAKGDVGSNVSANTQAAYQNARDFAGKAWKEVKGITATDDMLADLPNALQARASEILVDDVVTPAAARMAKFLDAFHKGEAPAAVADILPTSATRDVGQMRKTLYRTMTGAKTPEDQRAAGALYDAYNDWVQQAAIKSGDPSIAAKMAVARGMTRQMYEIFTGKPGSPGAAILKKVLQQGDTPELIVNALFSAPAKADIKTGSREALVALKRGYDTYLPPEAARAAWDDIRMAFWLRTVQQKTGEAGGPAAMSTAIRSMVNNHGSIAKLLFSPQEIARFRRLTQVLDEVKQRNPNTSWSGISIGAFMKDIGDAALTMLGANSVFGKMAIRFTFAPVRNNYGAVQARRATGNLGGYQPPNRAPLSLGDLGAGAGAQYGDR